MNQKRPFVVATFAMTIDGKVTTKNLSPVDFTSREDKLHLFRQRALADAVLIGHTSLKRDNVRLGLPADMQETRAKGGQGRCPLRVIVSNEGRIDHRLTLFRSLLEQGLIDQLNLTIAPYMFGGAKAPTLTGLSTKFLPASVPCSLSDMRTIGDECFLTYRIRHSRRRRK